MTTLALLLLAAMPAVPQAAKKPVVDEYHGVKVTDDYRWLENGEDAEVQKWSDDENALTRAVLDKLPGREALTKRVRELLTFEAPTWVMIGERKGTLFAMKYQPPRNQPMVVVLESLSSTEGERVLLDPLAIDAKGETSMDWVVPSLDGKYLAVSLSKKGSERGDVHVYEVATGKELTGDVIPWVNSGTAGGSLAWTADGFFYTRHPLENERPKEDLGFFQQVAFHKLKTAAKSDAVVLGKDFIRIAENFLFTTRDGKWAADLVQKGDGGEYELFLRSPDGAWTKVANYEDRIVGVQFGRDGAAYLLSRKDALKGKVLRLPLVPGKLALAQATVLVPEGDGAISELIATKSRVYVTEQLGGPSRVRMFGLDGKLIGEVPAPPVTAVSLAEAIGEGDDMTVYVSGYLSPLGITLYDAKANTAAPTPYAAKSPVDLSGYEVQRVECTSKDGTKVPLNLIQKKGTKRNGKNPTLLNGYGGYGVSMNPGFNKKLPVWLEAGGVMAIANLRGGGEFGEAWHQAGMLHKKQNVFDDFLGCAQWLVKNRVTSPKLLAIEGGSNGGLLMGAALTQSPKSFRAVVSHVGLYDMLRSETTTNGMFNTTEYGTVKDEGDFKAMYAYSPYHHVKKGMQYPAILFLTGKNDPRVDPWHSRKMIAALQASSTKQPVLLRTADTGHGIGTPLDERIAQAVDVYAFLFAQLGLKAPK